MFSTVITTGLNTKREKKGIIIAIARKDSSPGKLSSANIFMILSLYARISLLLKKITGSSPVMTGSFKVEFVYSKSSSISMKKTVCFLPSIFIELVNSDFSLHSLYMSTKSSESKLRSSSSSFSRLSLKPVKMM